MNASVRHISWIQFIR